MDKYNEQDLMEEMTSEEEEVNKEVWTLQDGTECTKSAFVREQFVLFNKSRKEISEGFDIPYRTVYGATVNMENDAEPTARGRGVTFSKINVTEDNKIVTEVDGFIYVDGEEHEGPMPVVEEVDRNEWIIQKVKDGMGRGDVARLLDVSYGVVYNLTKDLAGARKKYEIELEDGTVVSRSEYIRKLAADGMTRAEIAKELDVQYSVVWQATKKMKTVEEKFNDAIAALEKFIDSVVDPDALDELINKLGQIEVIEEEADTVDEE